MKYGSRIRSSCLIQGCNSLMMPGFRFQELEMVLYIPYEAPFQMERDLRYLLSSGYYASRTGSNTWKFTPSGLECADCYSEDELEEEAFGFLKKMPMLWTWMNLRKSICQVT